MRKSGCRRDIGMRKTPLCEGFCCISQGLENINLTKGKVCSTSEVGPYSSFFDGIAVQSN